MTQQYLRQLSLVVANAAGQGVELGALRVVFEVRRGDLQTPNTCDVRVYNLADSTANTIKQTEFTQLVLKASYQGKPLATIFQGSIKQVRKGREDQLNNYVAITAADGDHAYNFATSAFTLAAGSTAQNSVAGLIQSMAKSAAANDSSGQILQQGYTPQFSSNKSVRGRCFYGLTRDELRDFATTNDCKWTIQDGYIHFIPNTGYIPGETIVISPYTGLVGVPEQTHSGLSLRILLNPSIKIGQRVQLNSKDINQYRYGLDTQSVALTKQLAESATKLNADGMYYVMRAEHFGDTRGNNWYTDLICLAVDATVPLDAVRQAAIAPSTAVPRYP